MPTASCQKHRAILLPPPTKGMYSFLHALTPTSQVQRAVHLKRMILEDLQTSHAVRCRPAAEDLQTSHAGRQQRQLPEPEPRDGGGDRDRDWDGRGPGPGPSAEDAYVPMAMAPPRPRGQAPDEEPGLHEAPRGPKEGEELLVDDEAELL